MGWLQHFAVPCLIVAGAAVSGASAGGVRASRRTTGIPISSKGSLGCYRDEKEDRRLSNGYVRDGHLTPDDCKTRCTGRYSYYAVQYGAECWCGLEGEDYSKFGNSADCTMPCSGDATVTCGGYNAFEIFELEVVPQPPQPEGHIGCYNDDKEDRLFAYKHKDYGLTSETCKATCSSNDDQYAFYGLQYGRECWCGLATDQYARHGEGYCNYECAGDAAAICGGYTTMDIFSIDGTIPTPPPTTRGTTYSTVEPTLGGTTYSTVEPTLAGTTYSTVEPTTGGSTYSTVEPTTGGTTYSTVEPTTGVTTTTPSVVPTTVAPSPEGSTYYTVEPTTMGPTTLPPATPSPVTPGAVLVDLVPCIISPATITEATSGSFVMQQFFKGYWTPKTITEIVTSGETDLYAMFTDDSDTSISRGLCNAVYVGIKPSDAQYLALATYSAQFKVRIVYFDTSVSYDNLGVQEKLGVQPFFEGDIQNPQRIRLTSAGGELASITSTTLESDPRTSALFTVPVRQNTAAAQATILAEYGVDDDAKTPITSGGFPSVALMSYKGDDGSEELYAFFPIAWFDAESWAWAHYFNEWASKGIFMGERRFYLGAVVDDLFLSTPEYKYVEADQDERGERCTKENLIALKAVQDDLNAKYNSKIVTEFAANNAGILEELESPFLPEYVETDVTVKGTKWSKPGQDPVHDPNWLANSVTAMQTEFASGSWDADNLLMEVLDDTAKTNGKPANFYHQSHTLIHLSRDQLREADCFTEDTGNVQIALLTGMWDGDNYNWRSMVSPGITGLFNKNCLKSGADNLMTCYPGDNTYDGTVEGTVLLINKDEPYHSLWTTEADNGYAGVQIIPRFATFVYFNCITGGCLVLQNEAIRRKVCECEFQDPNVADRGTCASTEAQCVDSEGNTDIQSFGSIDEVFDTEAATTTRYLLAGRRDKYMFHQANIIPATDLGDMSALEFWYKRVMEEFSKLITFPVQSVKFDDLCTNFQLHQALDSAKGYVTMTVEEDGTISDLSYNAGEGDGAGLVPFTVPTALEASIPISSLDAYQYDETTYGTDTTYYLADPGVSTPKAAVKPDKNDLAAVPAAMTAAEVEDTVIETTPGEEEQAAAETEEAKEKNEEVLNKAGFADELADPAE